MPGKGLVKYQQLYHGALSPRTSDKPVYSHMGNLARAVCKAGCEGSRHIPNPSLDPAQRGSTCNAQHLRRAKMICGHKVSARLDGHLDEPLALVDEYALLLLCRAVEDAGHALRAALLALLCLSIDRCKSSEYHFFRHAQYLAYGSFLTRRQPLLCRRQPRQ